jgi:hypothetical protein
MKTKLILILILLSSTAYAMVAHQGLGQDMSGWARRISLGGEVSSLWLSHLMHLSSPCIVLHLFNLFSNISHRTH